MVKSKPNCITCKVRGISLLKDCSAGLVKEISQKKTSHFLKMGTDLMNKDNIRRGIFCIRSGVVKVEAQNKKGGSLILRLEGKGAIVGLRGTEETGREPLTITAIEDIEACHLSEEEFRSLVLNYPELQIRMNKALLTEISGVEQKALSLANNSVRERIAEALLQIAAVYEYIQRGRPVRTHLDRQDMAELAGTTREQVSKVLADFRRAGLISFKAKHLKYFNLPGLRKVSEGWDA